MRASPKEILNNKSNKMVDLILDEIRNGGAKTIAAGFTHEKTKKDYVLTVGITVTDTEEKPITPEDLCENCSCNCKPQNPSNEDTTNSGEGNNPSTEDTTNSGEGNNSSTEEEPTPNIPVVDGE